MPKIPNYINGVKVIFASTANEEVDQKLIDALKCVIRPGIPEKTILREIYVSSANDSHKMPSRHAQKKGIDISRINGTKMVVGYGKKPEITAIVDRLQSEFENCRGRRENFGPSMKKKLGNPKTISGHDDHIHFSVD